MNLDQRMKEYEKVSSYNLLKKTPVILRIDGKAFHTYTKGMDRPFSEDLHTAMVETTKFLTSNIQGAKFGYTQSDEISILITDWDTDNYNPKTEAWFNNKLSKLVSVSASYATAVFNSIIPSERLAFFDSRAFNLPRLEVNNYFIWRQQDAIRNSVQSLGQSKFSHKELQRKNAKDIKEMLQSVGCCWDLLDSWKKQGTSVYHTLENGVKTLIINDELSTFQEDRTYIENYLYNTID